MRWVVLEHDVQVLVVLIEHVGDGGLDAIDVALELAASARRRLWLFQPEEPREVLGLAA
jgi:hypothetical protein